MERPSCCYGEKAGGQNGGRSKRKIYIRFTFLSSHEKELGKIPMESQYSWPHSHDIIPGVPRICGTLGNRLGRTKGCIYIPAFRIHSSKFGQLQGRWVLGWLGALRP